jgi:hypothetical protein
MKFTLSLTAGTLVKRLRRSLKKEFFEEVF